ncbi:MAG: NAD-dependent epimerase/dehydratase family protein [Acutalibacter muris]|nr:NAD-dependent epimerase/dehydratase family protein [Acutalibacter muris]
MSILEISEYRAILQKLREDFPFWHRLSGKTILITGASGMLGSLLVDAVMLWNEERSDQGCCSIIGVVRNLERAKARFAPWSGRPELTYIQHDVCEPLPELPGRPDFWIHAASTTHPVAYSTEPVNTIMANVLGTRNMLDRISELGGRFLLLSSVEVYGGNRGDAERFSEDYCGYIDCNTLRAGYPEAKRVSEALCQAYSEEHGVDAVILRLPRCYGPTMQMTDSKAVAQFIKKAVRGENIVLKSEGRQFYSYAHAADAVKGMLWTLCVGEKGEAYNLADGQSDITLRDLARTAAESAGTEVVFELPEETEKKGFSKVQRAVLDAEKLKGLGWRASYSIRAGVAETITILRKCANG